MCSFCFEAWLSIIKTLPQNKLYRRFFINIFSLTALTVDFYCSCDKQDGPWCWQDSWTSKTSFHAQTFTIIGLPALLASLPRLCTSKTVLAATTFCTEAWDLQTESEGHTERCFLDCADVLLEESTMVNNVKLIYSSGQKRHDWCHNVCKDRWNIRTGSLEHLQCLTEEIGRKAAVPASDRKRR